MLITHEDLKDQIGDIYLQRGRAYHRENRVTLTGEYPNRIVALVRGSGRNRYEVDIELTPTQLGTLIEGDCSCPMGYNCKHVAAALLAHNESKATRSPGVNGGNRGLDPSVNLWLEQLVKHANSDDSHIPSDTPYRTLYLLDRHPSGDIHVTVIQARKLVSGEYSEKWKPYNIGAAFNTSVPAKFLSEKDLAIFRRLLWSRQGAHFPLNIDSGEDILKRILTTGRGYWHSLQGPQLREAEPRQAQIQWQLGDNGSQHLVLDDPSLALVGTQPTYYIDTLSGDCGLLQSHLPATVIAALNRAPSLSPDQARLVCKELNERLPALALPKPTEIAVERVSNEPPEIHLFLGSTRTLSPDFIPGTVKMGYFNVPFAQLEFSYRGNRMSYTVATESIEILQGDTCYVISRDKESEEVAFGMLKELGLQPLEELGRIRLLKPEHRKDLGFPYLQADDNWHRFVQHALPVLEGQGWHIEIDESFPFRYINLDMDDLAWYSELDEGDGEWFSLELGVEVEGEQINLLPVLQRLISEAPSDWDLQTLANYPADSGISLPLEDGRWIKFDIGRIRDLLGNLIELYDRDSLDDQGKLIYSRKQAARLLSLKEAMAAADMRWMGSDRLQQLITRLQQREGLAPIAPPAWFQAQLRDYQQYGLSWLGFLREIDMGGILADDMGLGKTVQTLAHLAVEKAAGRLDRPCLIVAPTSLMGNWRREAEKFAPKLQVLVLHGPDRAERFERIKESDLVLTTYPLLHRDSKYLLDQEYHYLILDEAQIIKNPRAQATLMVHCMKARHRLCLTGTPMENHLGELWSLFHFLAPGLLGDEKRFRTQFRSPIEKEGNSDRQALLTRRIAPFLLRRTKQEVATELPEKSEIIRTVVLEGKQRDLYESIRVSMDKKIRDAIAKKGVKRSHIEILDALLKLRQTCCDPKLLKLDHARKVKQSAKLDTLLAMLPSLIEEGRKILLFSQFTSMLKLIEEKLDQAGLDYVKLTGSTQDREAPVTRFQNGEVPLFLISLKAGGTGLNLTAADTVIHYDPWWNPAVENQATDRAYRIGQDKPVFVYKLVTEGTVEEKIVELQQRKQALADSVLQGGSDHFVFDENELRELLAPLS